MRRELPRVMVDYVFERPAEGWPAAVPWPKVRTRASKPGYGYQSREEAKRSIRFALACAGLIASPVKVQLFERSYVRGARGWAWTCTEKVVPL